MREFIRRLDTEPGLRHLRWVIAALVLLALAVFIGRGGSRPRDPKLVDQPATAGPGGGRARAIPGFAETALVVTDASGARRFCAALAATDAQRAQGLMGRTDLGGYDAMVFRFDQDATVKFYMRNTPLPLSIAWFDSGGRFVSATDMGPCPDRPGCPEYAAAGPYRTAIEVRKGGLRALGIGHGSSIAVGGSCA